MTNDELLYLLALQKAKGIGDINAKKLIKHCGSVAQVFKEKESSLLKIDGFGSFKIKGLRDPKLLDKAEKELKYILRNNINYVSFLESNYPKRLQNCADSPILFFYKGKINFNTKNIISIVGTRNMTNYGKRFLEQFFEDLKPYNPLIISGLAYGVDVFSHQLAVKHNFQTIGVVAHGLDILYPKTHEPIAKEMQKNGGILSDFWSGSKPERENFIKRNRIVAGISQATIIIESAIKGGSLITADIASSYNKDVFALPGRVTDLYSQGCNNLIKTNKAAVLTSVKDIAYILNWDKPKQDKFIQKQLFIELNTEEQKVVDYLLTEGKQSLDLIALHCNLPIYKISSLLLNLELKGVLKPLPGKLFEII